jgi:hypothetical protein
MLQYGIRAPIFNTEPGWAKKVEIEVKFHREFTIIREVTHVRASEISKPRVLEGILAIGS